MTSKKMRNQFFRVAILSSALCTAFGSMAFSQTQWACKIKVDANPAAWVHEEVFGSKFPFLTKKVKCGDTEIATGGGFRYEGIQHYTDRSQEWHVVVNEPIEGKAGGPASGWTCGIVSTIEREVVIGAPLWCSVICCDP